MCILTYSQNRLLHIHSDGCLSRTVFLKRGCSNRPVDLLCFVFEICSGEILDIPEISHKTHAKPKSRKGRWMLCFPAERRGKELKRLIMQGKSEMGAGLEESIGVPAISILDKMALLGNTDFTLNTTGFVL
ncbi:MAG: uncharacterized protein A8A55_0124 [Amphiamblys sp. WSBS2006]|nr:MAG: uncharacterized protein A8A55_0124 [Amphiamblys sp. WSBS2006]